MANPASLISEIRSAADQMMDAVERSEALMARYVALGGESALAPHFEGPDGPRTDLDYTQAEIVGALVSFDTVKSLLASGHRTNLEKVR